MGAGKRGYRVDLEAELSAGGRVDLVLSRGEERLACEISVTTGLDHEMANVRKCLTAAGEESFERIFAVSLKRPFLKALAARLDEAFAEAERERVSAVTPEELLSFLDERPGSEGTVAGYRVVTRVKGGDPGEAERRRATLVGVVGRSLRRARKGEDPRKRRGLSN